MDVFELKPLARLKQDVRKRVEEHLDCELENLTGEEITAIQRQIVSLRYHYQRPGTRRWHYGKNRHRLIAYALAYYPYHVELVGEAIQAALQEFRVSRSWDLAPEQSDSGESRFAIVGCGAAPELYGLLRYLASRLYSSGQRASITPDISIALFEPELPRWRALVEALTKPLIQRSPWLMDQLDAQQIRINWSQDREPIPRLKIRGQYDFVLIQCVLNELSAQSWSAWVSQVMEANVAPGGLICVIDMDPAVHDQLSSLGFHYATHLTLRWSDSGPRELDPTTSGLLFAEADGRRERLNVRATASFWEKMTISKGRSMPPRRVGVSRLETPTERYDNRR